ncbi:MAG: nucleotidyltransferase domain-containing protein [Odoribacter sp.]|nr:nucleotidyltransferase domain-containing protein [Odoribacter sp.]
MGLIKSELKNIWALYKKYKVLRLFVFASVLTEKFNEESDSDFVVDFDKENVTDYFDNYFDLKYVLEALFHRRVDLLEGQTIWNLYLRQSVEKTKTLIYG